MRKLYLEGLPRLRSLVCVLRCPGSCFANEVIRFINIPRRYNGRSNDHGFFQIKTLSIKRHPVIGLDVITSGALRVPRPASLVFFRLAS